MSPLLRLGYVVLAALTGATVGQILAMAKEVPGVEVAQSVGGCPPDEVPWRIELSVLDGREFELELSVRDCVVVVSWMADG